MSNQISTTDTENNDLTFAQYVRKILPTVVMIAVIANLLVVIALALLGPSVGNVFSNVIIEV